MNRMHASTGGMGVGLLSREGAGDKKKRGFFPRGMRCVCAEKDRSGSSETVPCDRQGRSEASYHRTGPDPITFGPSGRALMDESPNVG